MDVEEADARGRGMHASVHILTWMFFSNLTVLFNKWILDTGFRYPILLTCWHLVFASAATQLLARRTSLLDSRLSLPMTTRLYVRKLVPIGALYTGSLVCSNLVYLHLSVAFIQMLKAAAPVVALFVSWACRVEEPSLAALANILVMVAGVAIASLGEIRFSLAGFLFQLAGTVFEAVRLTMIQVMLNEDGLMMEPLVCLYYYAPVCAALNILVALPSELPRFQWQDVTPALPWMMLLNAVAAFMLNVASVFLIGKTSGLVMTLVGILKSIVLILISVVIWQTEITPLQAAGYALALAGLGYYSVGRERLGCAFRAVVSADADWAPWSLPSGHYKRSRAGFVFAAVCTLVVFAMSVRHYGADFLAMAGM